MTSLPGEVPITDVHLAALALAVLGLLLLLLLAVRARAGQRPEVRALRAFDRLPAELGRSAESGTPLHFAIGPGAIGGDRTLSSLAALEVLEGLADAAVAYGASPVVTVGDPTLLPLAQDVLRRAYIRQGIPEQYNPTTVRFVASQPAVYAAGAGAVASSEKVGCNVIAGSFEEEASLVSHAAEARRLPLVAAVDRVRALGALYPADAPLAVGEELYAGAARLTGFSRHLASLRVQDILRFLLIAVIVLRAIGIL